MTQLDFQAIAPLVVVATLATLLTVLISLWRHHLTTMVVTLLGFVLALMTLPDVAQLAPHRLGTMLVVDRFAVFVMALVLLSSIVTVLLSYANLKNRPTNPAEFYVLLSTATLGALTLAAATHFAMVLLGLETLSMSLYALIAYPIQGRRPLEAALKYLVLSGVASATLLFGVALLFVESGQLGFAPATWSPSFVPGVFYFLGVALFLGGVAFKLSLAPFHMWTPDVYEGAPAPVAGFLATVAKAALFAVLLRYVITSGVLGNHGVMLALTVFAILSVLVGNLLALLQESLKRVLAYSSIGHFGYVLLGLLVTVPAGTALATETTLVYLAGYVVMSLLAFGVVELVSNDVQADREPAVQDIDGLFWRRPWLATGFALALLSLAGMPLTLGFIAKFYLFSAGVQTSSWPMLWALVIGSAIGAFYYLRLIYAMTRLHDRAAAATPVVAALSLAGTATFVLGVLVLALGLYPTPLINEAQHAAIEEPMGYVSLRSEQKAQRSEQDAQRSEQEETQRSEGAKTQRDDTNVQRSESLASPTLLARRMDNESKTR